MFYKKKHSMLLFLTVISLSLIMTAEVQAQNYYVYAAAESEDEVALIRFDGKTAHVEKRIPVGVWPFEIEGPHGLAVSLDGKYWYLTMAHGRPNGHLYKYSTGDDVMIDRVELGLFPATMQISPATGLLYIVNFNLHGDHVPSTVSIVDPETMTEIEQVTTGIMPHGSRISPDGLHHYSVAMMDGQLYEINTVTMVVERKLFVGNDSEKHLVDMMNSMQMGSGMDHKMEMPTNKPTWAYPHPTERFVYVANNGANEVVEVDLDAWKVTRRFPTPPGPYNVEVSKDGTKMVISYKSDATIGVWDLIAGKEIAKLPSSRKITHGVALSPDSRYAFVTSEGIGSETGVVEVVDLNTLQIVAIAEIGKQAGGIAFWKIEK